MASTQSFVYTGRNGSGKRVKGAMDAANEVAVAAFLEGQISFMDIARLVESCCEAAARDSNGRAMPQQ